MNVHWTEAALADLRTAEAHIARHSPQYAASLIERIFSRSGQLADLPIWAGWFRNTNPNPFEKYLNTPIGSFTDYWSSRLTSWR